MDRSARGGVEKPAEQRWSQGTADSSLAMVLKNRWGNGGPKAPWIGQLIVVLKNQVDAAAGWVSNGVGAPS